MRFALSLACASLTAGAVVACPATLADADKGILVTYSNGSTAELRRDPDTGTVTELYIESDGFRTLNEIEKGIHLLSWAEADAAGAVVEGTSSTNIFEAAPPDELAPGTNWSVPYRITGALEGARGTYTGQVGVVARLEIGTCGYDILPVTLTLKDQDFTALVRLDYVPALGLSLLRATGELAGETTLLTPISIAAAPQP
jgi:hypothetical protein